MLSSIISGKMTSSMIIIEDRVGHVGSDILQAVIHNSSQRQLEVHLLCFENPIEHWKHVLRENVYVHDCFTDHRGWNNDLKENDLQLIYGEKGLVGVVQEIAKKGGKPCVMCIDSLVPVIFRHGLSKCYRDLHALLTWSKQEENKLNQLIAVIHEDAIEDQCNILGQLRHLAITLFQVQQSSPLNSSGWSLVRVIHRKPGGKIIKQIEEYKVEKNGSLESHEKKDKQTGTAEAVDPTVAMQNLTTFKLTLNPKEEEARSQLVLPYIKQNQPEGVFGGGKVFYEPDAVDDWDDEDPDDDLDV